ncbi:hypothetical protein KY284_028417 [Solanum tuberosum]|nr:hypothetical protein KY284_028417 [Solanum tuberosum]
MESKKLQRPRWLDSFLGPKNSKSQWLQDNLEEMNWNFRRMLKIIEDSNAESFAKKVEMYYESRQELINLVYKCYGIHRSLAMRHNHATGEPLINIPNLDLFRSQGRDIIISNVSSGKSSAIQSRPLLSKFPSSKQINAPVCSVSKQLKRRVSVKGPKCSYDVERAKCYSVKVPERKEPERPKKSERRKEPERPKKSERPKEPERPTCYSVKEPERPKEPGYLKYYSVKETERPKEQGDLKCYVESQSDDDDDYDDEYDSYDYDDDDEYDSYDYDDDDEELQHEGTDELEAELCDMIEKLYIEMEGDRVVSMLQGGILRYEDNAHDDDEEFRQVRESISSNVDKALLEVNLELQAEICRLLKEMSYLEEYNEEIEAIVAERDQLKARVATLTADLRMYLEGIDCRSGRSVAPIKAGFVACVGPDTAWGLLVRQFLLIIEYVGVLYVLLCV